MLQKRSFQLPSYDCVLCGVLHLETRDHLFFHCAFAKTCWAYLCGSFTPVANVHLNVESLKRKLKVPFFMEIIIMGAWSIWKVRNDFIFNQRIPSLYRCSLYKVFIFITIQRPKKCTIYDTETQKMHYTTSTLSSNLHCLSKNYLAVVTDMVKSLTLHD